MLLNFKKKALSSAVSTDQVVPKATIESVKQELSNKILGKTHKLEMVFRLEDSKRIMQQFFIDYGFTSQDQGVFIPESTVIKAHNYGDLIIALKMQHVFCENWMIGIDTHCYSKEKDHAMTIPMQFLINGMEYLEIYQPMPVYVDRGNNLKTRWKGLEDELNHAYTEYDDSYEIVWTDVLFTGNCRFRSTALYEEFKFLQQVRDAGKFDTVFQIITKDLQKKGFIDNRYQPVSSNHTAMPNMVDYFFEYSDKDVLQQLGNLAR